jgi:hypothetical protein
MKKPKFLQELKSKEAAILVAAIVVPGGLVALGLWKAYELLRKKDKKDDKTDKTE